MTAGGDGKQLDAGPGLSSVLERPDAEAVAVPRSLDRIFPLRGDPGRARAMQETWRAFGAEMAGAVTSVLGGGRSPPEIAYAIGEIVHNYFRTRGVTLTSFELRRLVAELLQQRQRGDAPPPSGDETAPADGSLVRFAGERAAGETAWTGADAAAAETVMPDAVFDAPPSALVTVAPRDGDAAVLADVTAKVRARLGADAAAAPRQVVVDAIVAVLEDRFAGDAEARHRFLRPVLSDICGLGPIDRLWADRSIRAVFVNGPAWIFVERNGVLEPSADRFRDRTHLEQVAARLARSSPSVRVPPTAHVRLRDGGEATVIFPPAAPEGPIVVLRRGEPGDATFERLIAAGRLSRPMADLLRIAARSRLNLQVVGPAGAGKTALLAAIARDLAGARVVTLAPHRHFRWPSASKIELTVSPQASFSTLLAAGAQLRPDLLVVDSLRPSDAAMLGALLARGLRGVVAAGEPSAVAGFPPGVVDLVVRLGPDIGGLFVVAAIEDAVGARLFVHQGGGFHRRTAQPSFAAAVRDAGHGEALASVLI